MISNIPSIRGFGRSGSIWRLQLQLTCRPNMYQYHIEVCSRYMILELYCESGTMMLGVIEALQYSQRDFLWAPSMGP